MKQLVAYAQLVRLPNTFTAMADIALGFLFKYTMLLLVPGLIVYAVLRRRSLAPMLIYILMAAVLFFRPSGLFPVKR